MQLGDAVLESRAGVGGGPGRAAVAVQSPASVIEPVHGVRKTRFSALRLIDWRQRRVRLCRASGQHWQAHCLDREGTVLAPGSLKCRQNHFIFRWLGDRKMRHVLITLTSFALLGGASAAQARELAANDRYICSWGRVLPPGPRN